MFFAGVLGAVVLLGFLSLAVILAQVVALVLLGFAPVALVIGIFPRAGHDFFRNWLAKLATAVFIKALYSLVIAIVVAVAAALQASTESLGFLFSFGLQAIFFWAIFVYRKQITARLVAATTGAGYDGRMPRMTVVQRAGDVATRPFVALVGMRGRGGRDDTGRQESALAGDPAPETSNGAPVAQRLDHHDHDIRPEPVVAGNGSGDGHRPMPARPSGASPAARPSAPANGNGSAPARIRPIRRRFGLRARSAEPKHELSPRASHEDAMRRARELRERQRAGTDNEAGRS